MTDLALYRTRRDSEGLHIIPRYRARGTQTLPKPAGHAPTGPIGGPLSPLAELLRDAMKGDSEAEIRIVNELTRMVVLRAKAQNWGLRGDLRGLAVIALRPFIYQEELSDPKAAKECKISRSTYRRNWKNEKLDEVRKWVKTIHAELN